MPGGRLAEPPWQGTPCRVPSSPHSAKLLDVLLTLEGQTTFKFDETRTITTVSNRASQYDVGTSSQTPSITENGAKRQGRTTPGAPTREGSAMGGRSMTDPHWQNA